MGHFRYVLTCFDYFYGHCVAENLPQVDQQLGGQLGRRGCVVAFLAVPLEADGILEQLQQVVLGSTAKQPHSELERSTICKMGNSTISMAMFDSYVALFLYIPEGRLSKSMII